MDAPAGLRACGEAARSERGGAGRPSLSAGLLQEARLVLKEEFL